MSDIAEQLGEMTLEAVWKEVAVDDENKKKETHVV